MLEQGELETLIGVSDDTISASLYYMNLIKIGGRCAFLVARHVQDGIK